MAFSSIVRYSAVAATATATVTVVPFIGTDLSCTLSECKLSAPVECKGIVGSDDSAKLLPLKPIPAANIPDQTGQHSSGKLSRGQSRLKDRASSKKNQSSYNMNISSDTLWSDVQEFAKLKYQFEAPEHAQERVNKFSVLRNLYGWKWELKISCTLSLSITKARAGASIHVETETLAKFELMTV
ncbi:hypothetical protein ACFE04_010281 [Oxalis oulophora]